MRIQDIPFLLETKIQELGGKYQSAEPWAVSIFLSYLAVEKKADILRNLKKSKVVVDGKLITGQNPASAAPLGEALLKALTA